jgi:Na+-transporting NADH:ubiquinone oxidoreductase subunit NqrD
MSKSLDTVKKGLLTKNPLFCSGLVLAAAVFTSDSLKTALTTALCFTIITAFTALAVFFLPLSKTPYTVRIILYILIASCVYVPVVTLSTAIFPVETPKIIVYIACICVNSLILERFDKRSLKKKSQKLLFIIASIVGFDVSLIIFSIIREIIAYGSVYGKLVGLDTPLPIFGYVFGGLILLGIFSGLFRYIIMKAGVTER